MRHSVKRLIVLLLALVLAVSCAYANPVRVLEEEYDFRKDTKDVRGDGSYMQVGSLPVQVWVPKNTFKVVDIPADEQFKDAVLMIACDGAALKKANPRMEIPEKIDLKLVFDFIETDQDKDAYLAEHPPVYADECDSGVYNGIPALIYLTYPDEVKTALTTAVYFIDGGILKITYIIANCVADSYARLMVTSVEPVKE